MSGNELLFTDDEFDTGRGLGKHPTSVWGMITDFKTFETFKDITVLLPFIKKYKVVVLLSGLLFFASMGLALSIPKILGHIVDILFKDTSHFHQAFMTFFAIFALKVAFEFLYKLRIAKIGEDILRDLRLEIIEILGRMPARFFDINSSGKIISRSVNDVTNLSLIFNSSIYQAISESFTILGASITLLVLYPSYGVFIGGLSLLLLFLLFQLSFSMGKKMRKMRSVASRLNTFTADTMNGLEIILCQGLREKWKKDNSRLTQLYYLSTRKAILFAGRFPAIHATILGACYFALISVMAPKLYNGTLSRGDFVAILFYTSMIFVPFHEIFNKMNEFQMAMSSMHKIRDILSLRTSLEEDPLAVAYSEEQMNAIMQEDILFSGVHFSYGDERYLFKDFNLKIPKGKITALIGKTGSGKTSLSGLITRLYPIQKGMIRLGSTNIDQIPRHELYQRVGIVSQNLFLFQDTVRENLRLYDKNISDDLIWQVLDTLKLTEKFMSLTYKLDTFYSKQTEIFSQGERQLIIIARMLLRNPNILIFDEATASLDNESEFEVQKALSHLFPGRTTIIIAHRLSTIQLADHVVVLDKGAIVEEGAPQELLGKRGAYYKYLNLIGHK